MRERFFVLSSLLAALVLLAPSCRHKRPPLPPQVAPPVTETTAPPPAERVAPPEADFPKESSTPEFQIEDIEELNRMAQERGWIRDAMFAFDSSTLNADAQQALRDSATWLRAHSEYGLFVQGHCDNRGTEQYNLALGDRRASAAAQFLEASGVDAARIRTVSYGEERPFAEGSDEEVWALNRRAHLVLVKR
jgi:peptidoglycan-associated lipoprotein